jgi:hypothetical protein
MNPLIDALRAQSQGPAGTSLTQIMEWMRAKGLLPQDQIYDPSKQVTPATGQPQVVGGVRPAQIDRAEAQAVGAPAAPPQGIPAAGGQGFFNPGQRQLTPEQLQQLKLKLQQQEMLRQRLLQQQR